MAGISATFYTTNDDPRTIGKTLTNPEAVTVHVYESSTVTEPKLILKYNAKVMKSNYVELGDPYNRKYFVGPPATLAGGRICVPCMVDVRETYKEGIRDLTPIVTRREDFNHGLLVDECMPFVTSYENEWVTFGEIFKGTLDANTPCIVLEVIGEPVNVSP